MLKCQTWTVRTTDSAAMMAVLTHSLTWRMKLKVRSANNLAWSNQRRSALTLLRTLHCTVTANKIIQSNQTRLTLTLLYKTRQSWSPLPVWWYMYAVLQMVSVVSRILDVMRLVRHYGLKITRESRHIWLDTFHLTLNIIDITINSNSMGPLSSVRHYVLCTCTQSKAIYATFHLCVCVGGGVLACVYC